MRKKAIDKPDKGLIFDPPRFDECYTFRARSEGGHVVVSDTDRWHAPAIDIFTVDQED